MRSRKLILFYLIFSSFFWFSVYSFEELPAGCNQDGDKPFCDPSQINWADDGEKVIQYLDASQIPSVPSENVESLLPLMSSDQKKALSAQQLSSVDVSKYGDLGQYGAKQMGEALQLKGFSVASFSGDFSGAFIQGDLLVLKDGSKINLKDGKEITLENAPDKVVFYQDAKGNACINCVGLEVDNEKMTAMKADSLSSSGATVVKVDNYAGNFQEKTFTFATADQLIIGPTIINKLMVSTFKTENNAIKSAILLTSQNDNQFTLYCNNIPFETMLSQQQSIHLNCTTENGKDVESFSVFTKIDPLTEEPAKVLIKTKKNNIPLSWENTATESSFKIIDFKETTIRRSTFNFSTSDFTEQLIGNCHSSTVEISNNGFARLTLKPTVTLCAGARYTFLDKQLKEKSFSIFNTGTTDYVIGFEKGILPATFYSTLSTQHFGFIEDTSSQKRTTLNSVLRYDRFLSREDVKLSIENYANANLPFQPVYQSFDTNTSTIISYNNEKITVALTTTHPTTETIAQVNVGAFKFLETLHDGISDSRFGFHAAENYPDYVTEYSAVVITQKAPVFIVNKTAFLRSKNADEEDTEIRLLSQPEDQTRAITLIGSIANKNILSIIKNIWDQFVGGAS